MQRKPFLLISILLPCTSIATQNLSDLEKKQGIYIKHEGQNTTAMKMLKVLRDQCVAEKNMLIKERAEDPMDWPGIRAALKRDRPRYNVDASLAKEPDWRNVMVKTEEEYFQGDLYAEYTTDSDYEIIDDGTCGFKATQQHSAEIDTGKFRYELDLDAKSGERFPSPVVIRKQYDASMKDVMQHNPMIGQMVAKTVVDMGVPQATKQLGELMKVTGQDHVAGQDCEYMGPKTGSKVCYWKTRHEYPSIMQRALILKSVVKLGNDTNITKAVKFTLSNGFDPAVFSVPDNFQIEKQM